MIRFYFKVFFINFILFGVLELMVYRLGWTAAPSPADALYLCAAFGLFMSLGAGTLHILMIKKYAGGTPVADPYSPAREAELSTSMPHEKLFALCRHYVADIAGYAITAENPGKGLITARTPWNWKGYGNIFSIDFSERKDGFAKVRIASRPRTKIVLLDYGDNLMNIMQAKYYLETNAR
ncbi:MAG: hypothetical protein WCW52_02680 [Elusimicrobiales bacterium]|jgi:hypothetical protein